MTHIQTAMILAAGRGKRMRELTDTMPKPLICIHGKPILMYIVEKLQRHGVRKTVVNLCYKGEMIQEALADCPNIVFSPEETALETGGGVKNALPLLGNEPFFVCNADPVWTDETSSVFEQLEQAWDPQTMDVLLAFVPIERARGAVTDGNYFIENNRPRRQRPGETHIPYLFMGVQIIHPRAFEGSSDGVFSLREIYDRAEQNSRLGYIVFDGMWYHVGTPEAVSETERLFQQRIE